MPTSATSRNKRLNLLKGLLGGVCVRCGTVERLEFDHIDPTTVSFRIGARADQSLKVLLPEVMKCQLLCHDCHWEKTRQDRDYGMKHGTSNMYVNGKCRCEDCRNAWRAYFVPKHKTYRQRSTA